MTLQLQIASPCEEKWESMQGNDRVRHCARCALNVFNVKELSEPEVRALFLKTEGRVCGRIFQRKDGTVLMRDCPTGLAKLRKKAHAGLAMAVSLVLAVIAFRMGTAKSCPTELSLESWFARVIGRRLIDARETLRDTTTFGPIINELYPRELPVAGLMIVTPPSTPPSP